MLEMSEKLLFSFPSPVKEHGGGGDLNQSIHSDKREQYELSGKELRFFLSYEAELQVISKMEAKSSGGYILKVREDKKRTVWVSAATFRPTWRAV